MKPFDIYASEHVSIIQKSSNDENICKLVESVLKTIENGSTIYAVGNGGSYTTAEHFAADLNLTFHRCGKKIRAYCIGSQLATQSALSNDISYGKALALQLQNSLQKNDVLVAFSASGKSLNIIESIKIALKYDLKIFAFTGFDGGEILKFNNVHNIHLQSSYGKYGEIENIHLMICHYVIDSICEKLG